MSAAAELDHQADDDPWGGYPPGQPIGQPAETAEIELVTLSCACGHTITGLPSEDQPCHACLFDDTHPHTCPLWRRPE